VRVKDVVIDLCATCGGVYLDRAELDSLIELRKDREADEAREELARTAKEGAQNVGLGVLGLLVDLLGGLF
jgi:Zn-finger nucleic acid-binding protein